MRLIDADKLVEIGMIHMVSLSDIRDAPTVDAVPVGWISIQDKLPERNERVLTFAPSRIDSDIGPVSVNWGWVCGSRAHKDVTHWMPLPQPPSAKMENIEGDGERAL